MMYSRLATANQSTWDLGLAFKRLRTASAGRLLEQITVLEKSGGFHGCSTERFSTCWGYAGLSRRGQSEEATATIYNLSRRMLGRH